MTREELKFDINYSYFLEKLYSRLMSRIDKSISVGLFILGGSVFTPYNNILLFGALVSILSAIKLFYQFAEQSALARTQAKKYLRLAAEERCLDDTVLRNKFNDLQDSDSHPWTLLEKAAYGLACRKLGHENPLSPMTFFQKWTSRLGGGD